jgi:hypothetical protein
MIQQESPKSLENTIWSQSSVTCIEADEWQSVEASDLLDAKVNEKKHSNALLDVKKIEKCTTRLRHDFYASDVARSRSVLFDWSKEDHVKFLTSCRRLVILLFDGRIAEASVLRKECSRISDQKAPLRYRGNTPSRRKTLTRYRFR